MVFGNWHNKRGWLATLLLGACFLYPLPADPITGDDIFLLSTAVSPNVVLIFDNSNTTLHREWHPAFDADSADFAYGCSTFDPVFEYYFTNETKPFLLTACGRTR